MMNMYFVCLDRMIFFFCRNNDNNCHFLFSGVNQDPCLINTNSAHKQIMFTTCTDEEFTCNDGLCIDIEKR